VFAGVVSVPAEAVINGPKGLINVCWTKKKSKEITLIIIDGISHDIEQAVFSPI